MIKVVLKANGEQLRLDTEMCKFTYIYIHIRHLFNTCMFVCLGFKHAYFVGNTVQTICSPITENTV